MRKIKIIQAWIYAKILPIPHWESGWWNVRLKLLIRKEI
jgi:hypothetical protein